MTCLTDTAFLLREFHVHRLELESGGEVLFDRSLTGRRKCAKGPVALHLLTGEDDPNSAAAKPNFSVQAKIEVRLAIIDRLAIHDLDFDSGFAAHALFVAPGELHQVVPRGNHMGRRRMRIKSSALESYAAIH